jgi:hypothetical protein
MKHDVQQEMKLRRYLLGELPLEEQVLVEQRLFLDSDYAELQQAVKDDLIDEYLVNEMIDSEREKFVKHFLLLPEHGADLRIAEALKKYLATENTLSRETDTNKTQKDDPGFFPFSFLNKPLVWLSMTVAALIIFSVIAWIVIRATRGPAAEGPQQARESQPTQSQPDNRQQAVPVPQNDNKVETAEGNTNGSPEHPDKPPERRSASGHTVVSAIIYAGSPTRGSGFKRKVTIYDDTQQVVLRLPLEFSETYDKYRAELLSGERKIDEQSDLKSQPDDKYGSVFVRFSTNILREQNYRIKLYGVPTDQQSAEPHITYPFTVERK